MRRLSLSLIISVALHIALLIIFCVLKEGKSITVREGELEVELMRRERPKVKRKGIVRRSELMSKRMVIAPSDEPFISARPFKPIVAPKLFSAEWREEIVEAPGEIRIELTLDIGREIKTKGTIGHPSPGKAVSIGRPLPPWPVSEHISGLEPKEINSDPLMSIADALIRANRTGKLDLIFLIDSSGTMRPHILRVAFELLKMAERIKRAGIELEVGVLKFNRIERQDLFETIGPTVSVEKVRRFLLSIRCLGDERARDALMEAFRRMRLRKGTERAFVLVTDERMKGRTGIDSAIRRAKAERVRVYVLGVEDEEQFRLARETGGMWFSIAGY